jgi:hypothetical protein
LNNKNKLNQGLENITEEVLDYLNVINLVKIANIIFYYPDDNGTAKTILDVTKHMGLSIL